VFTQTIQVVALPRGFAFSHTHDSVPCFIKIRLEFWSQKQRKKFAHAYYYLVGYCHLHLLELLYYKNEMLQLLVVV